MDVLAMFLMVFPIVGLFASAILLVLIMGIGTYSLADWWLARRSIAREVPVAALEEKFPT